MTSLYDAIIVLSILGVGCGYRYLVVHALLGIIVLMTHPHDQYPIMAIGTLILANAGSCLMMHRLRDRTHLVQAPPSFARDVLSARASAIALTVLLSCATVITSAKGCALVMVLSGAACAVLKATGKQLTGLFCMINGFVVLTTLCHNDAALPVGIALWIGVIAVGRLALPRMKQLLPEKETRV